MKRKRHAPQEIIAKLREAGVDLNQGANRNIRAAPNVYQMR
jgi:hypothetical protein